MTATGRHAPWRLWILVIFWILQYILLVLQVVAYIVVVVVLGNDSATNRGGNRAVGIVELVMAIISLLLTIFECIQISRHRLTPLVYLVSNTLKSAAWIALIVAAAVINSRDNNDVVQEYTDVNGNYEITSTASYEYSPSLTGIVTIVLIILFVLPVIYAAIVFHKNKTNRGAYNGVARQDPETEDILMEAAMQSNHAPQLHSTPKYYSPPQAPSHQKPGFSQQQQPYAPYQAGAVYG